MILLKELLLLLLLFGVKLFILLIFLLIIDTSVLLSLIAPLNHPSTQLCVTAERAMCKHLGGGCHVPVAAYATLENNQLHLRGLVGRPDGTLILRAEQTSHLQQSEVLGIQVAENLLQQGAGKILHCVTKS